MRRFVSIRLVLASAAFICAALFPLTIAPGGGAVVKMSSLCGSNLTTCCRSNSSECPGEPGFYDTGCYGKCGDLKCDF